MARVWLILAIACAGINHIINALRDLFNLNNAEINLFNLDLVYFQLNMA